MAFILRRPFAIANALTQVPRAAQTTLSQPIKQAFRSYSNQATPLRTFARKENIFKNTFRQSSRRSYQSSAPANPVAHGNLTQRLIYGGAWTIYLPLQTLATDDIQAPSSAALS